MNGFLDDIVVQTKAMPYAWSTGKHHPRVYTYVGFKEVGYST